MDFLSLPFCTKPCKCFLATSASSFRCYFHNTHFRTISPPVPLSSFGSCQIADLHLSHPFSQSWIWSFILIWVTELSKLFFTSACTGCQLFQSSLASCFSRTGNKGVLSIPLQPIKIFISWVTVRKQPGKVKHFQESEKKPCLDELNDRSPFFMRQIKHIAPVPSGSCSRSLAAVQAHPLPFPLSLIPSCTHSGHRTWQKLFYIGNCCCHALWGIRGSLSWHNLKAKATDLSSWNTPSTPYHRMEWNRMEQNRTFQLQGTYNDHIVQLPDQVRADQKLKHSFKGIVQMPFKYWQVWGMPCRFPCHTLCLLCSPAIDSAVKDLGYLRMSLLPSPKCSCSAQGIRN